MEEQELKKKLAEMHYSYNVMSQNLNKLNIECDQLTLFILCLIEKYGINDRIWFNENKLRKVEKGKRFGIIKEGKDIVLFLDKEKKDATNL